jgi:cyclophilin family peptidyl-prolyl cis-trans isomerase
LLVSRVARALQFKDDKDGIKVKLDRRGQVGMCNNGKNTNTSQFFFALDALPKLTGKHVVFGDIVEGDAVLARIEDAGEEATEGKPQVEVVIADCGVYTVDGEPQ